jgi:hypothetical protein
MNKTFENWMVEERGYKASTAKTYASEVRRGLDHHENGKPKGSAIQYKAWLEEEVHISEEAVQEEEQEEAVQEPKKVTFTCTVRYGGTTVITVEAENMEEALKFARDKPLLLRSDDHRVLSISEVNDEE